MEDIVPLSTETMFDYRAHLSVQQDAPCVIKSLKALTTYPYNAHMCKHSGLNFAKVKRWRT
jgi:hypothetical protein